MLPRMWRSKDKKLHDSVGTDNTHSKRGVLEYITGLRIRTFDDEEGGHLRRCIYLNRTHLNLRIQGRTKNDSSHNAMIFPTVEIATC